MVRRAARTVLLLPLTILVFLGGLKLFGLHMQNSQSMTGSWPGILWTDTNLRLLGALELGWGLFWLWLLLKGRLVQVAHAVWITALVWALAMVWFPAEPGGTCPCFAGLREHWGRFRTHEPWIRAFIVAWFALSGWLTLWWVQWPTAARS